MKPPTLPQLRKKVEKAIAKDNAFIAACEHNTNPQVHEMVIRARGRLDALEAVQAAISGDNVFMNILIGD
jgi:hypothetical protein